MKKLITLFAVLGMVLALAPAAQADLPAWTDSIVGGYRIAFITAGTYVADQTDITTYDGYVEAEAQAAGSLVSDITGWKVIGATVGVTARSHTDTVGSGGANDVPIYDVNGNMIALGNEKFWGTTWAGWMLSNADSLLATLTKKPDGTNQGADRVFTGIYADGSPVLGSELGQLTVVDGDPRQVDLQWAQRGTSPHVVDNDYNGGLVLYALSPVLGVPTAPAGTVIMFK